MSWNNYQKAAEKGPWPITLKILLFIVPLIAIIFIINIMFAIPGLEWMRFYETRKQNIQREIFEQTQSYVHGKIQDLSKYYREYQKAEGEDKEAIRSVINIQFAEFDANKIKSQQLQQFLINMRGY